MKTLTPAASLSGSVQLPGDKSVSHRYAMLAAIAEGPSRLHHYSTGADCQSTLSCLEALGIRVERAPEETVVHGQGLQGLRAPAADLDAGNSGSTIRMLSGILAGQPFRSTLFGDESLSRRPMQRIMTPLSQMGAKLSARDGKYPPLTIEGGPLQAIDYATPVASAQVKSCVLFAGLYADGPTTVREPVRTRDHSELALREFGADLEINGLTITLQPHPRLEGRTLTVPGDLSSAAFFLVAALLVPGSRLTIQGVGLNPTRAALIDFLVGMGGKIRVLQLEQTGGELIGDLLVEHAPVTGGTVEGSLTASLIDEIPVLSVLGAVSSEGLTVRDAGELRVKETDRIATITENLRRMGITVEEAPDGLRIPGNQRFRAAELDSHGDHRIAMAFSVAALAADGPCTLHDPGAASVSFPEFYDILARLAEVPASLA